MTASTMLATHTRMPEQDTSKEAVSIVVPAHNESAGITDMLTELVSTLEGARAALWEILVVDDGSTDGTGELVATMAEERLRFVRHERTQGYGAALKTGIRGARHSWILIIDADGTYPARHVPELLEHRNGNDMVIGARVGLERRIPWIRRPAKWALRKLASTLSGAEIMDLNSGLRVFKRELVERFLRLLPNGFSFTSTISLAALSSGASVEYLPIDYRQRKGRSKIRPIRDTLNFLILIIRTVIFFDPLRVLLPVSLFFVLAAVLVAVGSLLLTGQIMDVTTVVLLVAGVQTLVLGVIADTINRWLQ